MRSIFGVVMILCFSSVCLADSWDRSQGSAARAWRAEERRMQRESRRIDRKEALMRARMHQKGKSIDRAERLREARERRSEDRNERLSLRNRTY